MCVQADAPLHDDASGAYVTATAVTTRTATTHEDLGKNAKTQQLEEKTVATTTTHNLNRQEQRVVTQEVKTTATVTSGEQVNYTGVISVHFSDIARTYFDIFWDSLCYVHLFFMSFACFAIYIVSFFCIIFACGFL